MILLLVKILIYKLFYKLGFPKILPINYTVSLLYRCNSRCKTCNIYEKKADELQVSEYEKIFKKIGRSPYWVTLSGGEPFLRTDIVGICKAIYKYSRPKIINIPTNGILTERIVKSVKKISVHCPKSKIIINLSIDGIKKEHDNIRQVEGNYEKVIDTFNQLKNLHLSNLEIGIHSVISKFNVDDFPRIANILMSLEPDSYITEIAENRVELGTLEEDISPNAVAYKSVIDFLIHRIKQQNFKGLNQITQAFRIEYYNLVKKILRDKTQVIPCYAGIASAQISPEGDVWSCCIKAKSMGNLREYDYNFKKIWRNQNFKKERKSIKNKECYCPLANASYTNMLLNFKILNRVLLRILKLYDK